MNQSGFFLRSILKIMDNPTANARVELDDLTNRSNQLFWFPSIHGLFRIFYSPSPHNN